MEYKEKTKIHNDKNNTYKIIIKTNNISDKALDKYVDVLYELYKNKLMANVE